MCKLVIFDFDGTIVDSYDLIYDVISEYTKIKPNKQELKMLPTKIGVKYFKLSKLDLMKVILKIIDKHNKNLPLLKSFNGIKESLMHLKNQSIQLVLLTSAGEEIYSFLSNNSLENIFEKVYRVNPFLQKAIALEKIISDFPIEKSDVYYVADEPYDVIAAKKSGIKAVAVTWGYNDESVLRKYKPSYLIDKPCKLKNLVSS